jgi:hypothetical protein
MMHRHPTGRSPTSIPTAPFPARAPRPPAMNRPALPVRRERLPQQPQPHHQSAQTPTSPRSRTPGHRPTVDKDGLTAATFRTLAPPP